MKICLVFCVDPGVATWRECETQDRSAPSFDRAPWTKAWETALLGCLLWAYPVTLQLLAETEICPCLCASDTSEFIIPLQCLSLIWMLKARELESSFERCLHLIYVKYDTYSSSFTCWIFQSDITGEHTCVLLKPLENDDVDGRKGVSGGWLNPFNLGKGLGLGLRDKWESFETAVLGPNWET
jgi:hypothetical protein